MSKLSTFTLLIFAFSPLALTMALVGCMGWLRNRSADFSTDLPQRLLGAAVRLLTGARREWGAAMLAELNHVHGRFARWQFALGCAKVALCPPAARLWPSHWFDAFWRFEPKCGVLAVALPPLGLPLLYFTSIACNAFMEHDNFSSGEFVPTLLGLCIVGSLACILSGVPLGIVGLIRREQVRWLFVAGPLSSVMIFTYLQIVQHWARDLN